MTKTKNISSIDLNKEIDNAIWGIYDEHRRDEDGNPMVKVRNSDEWIPVNDWRGTRNETTLRRIARHFIELTKGTVPEP